MIIALQNITQDIWTEFICVGYSHSYQPFQMHPHRHDCGTSHGLFKNFQDKCHQQCRDMIL
jgi:hypothetical protein